MSETLTRPSYAPTDEQVRRAMRPAEPFGPPTLPDAYACGAIGARHAAREALAHASHRARTNGGRGSLAARRALALADIAVHEAITKLIEGGER